MTTKTFGQLDSWESESSGKRSKDDYLTIKTDGITTVRFLTEPPYKYYIHWVDTGVRKIKFNCAGPDCILCKQGNEAQKLYASLVLNRDLNRCQIFDFKKQIYDGLHVLHADKTDWGSLLNYDVKLDRKLARKPEVYKVTPRGKSPLTKEELVMIEEFKNRISLDKHCAIMDNATIEKRLADAMGGGGTGFGVGAQTFAPRNMAPAPVVPPTAVDEDPDFTFT